jgi:hypothetical protein
MAVIDDAAAAFKYTADYLGGANDKSPSSLPAPNSIFWGAWWGFLLFLVISFSGQSSKFIYIDF